MTEWPTVAIDPIVKLRAIAAAMPHVVLAEHVFDAPFDRLWRIIEDLEHGTPRYEGGVSAVEILERRPEESPPSEGGPPGERMRVIARSALGIPVTMDVVLRPGFCVMTSRQVDVGMAAVPIGDGARTRFAHFEGSPWLGRLGRPIFARNVRGDFKRLEGLLAG